MESIADQEKHLARNGTIILKFWLNVSRDEQKRRFLEPIWIILTKTGSLTLATLPNVRHWDKYMQAYEDGY